MTTPPIVHESSPDTHHDVYSRTIFGFWVYLLTDFMVFATLFITYAVLHPNTFGGPSGKELFNLPFTLIQTLLLLTSSLTAGLGGVCVHRQLKKWTLFLFFITFLLGVGFMWMEVNEFTRLIEGGNSWQRNAFLSVYFTLVGTHGLHMLFALLWVVVLLIPVCYHGIKPNSIKRLTCLRMFWQFLNIVWVFIFSIVYLLGVA
ncbi:MAG: Cytochrome bo(3) ubiquinol oxidase subunit 3 [Chlamydiales bacterium]|nr:Cytochrome bo(3) ubiquinol oxidase subunit 3 [Chlamydiales bacterium]